MIAFDLEQEHELTRRSIVDSWSEDDRFKRDAMPLSQMIDAFESSFWFEERAYLSHKKQCEKRKLKRRQQHESTD